MNAATKTIHCVRCNGTGLWGNESDVCFRCDGSGRDPGRKEGQRKFRERAAYRRGGSAAKPAAPAPAAQASKKARSARKAKAIVTKITSELRREFAPKACAALGVRSLPLAQLDAWIAEHRV